MTIDNVVTWYEKNVNYKLTKTFLNFLVKTGIINYDVDLELLNLFLLDRYEDDFVKENNKFKIKKNRIPVIDKFKEEKNEVKKEEKKEKPIEKKSPVKELSVTTKKKSSGKRFKIENLGGSKLKLVKL